MRTNSYVRVQIWGGQRWVDGWMDEERGEGRGGKRRAAIAISRHQSTGRAIVLY